MKIAVFFPGIGYTFDKPLLYYSRAIATERNFDKLVCISYSSDVKLDKTNVELVASILYQQAEKQLEMIDWDKCEEVIFFSKSIGTVISCEYARRHKISPVQILLTPLEATFDHDPNNAIAFSGTKDQWADYEEVARKCKEYRIPLHTYEGTNHSLEVKDIDKDIETVKNVISEVKKYIDKSCLMY